VRPRLEVLEDRALPATGLAASLSNGLLSITDTRAFTSVVVREVNDRFMVDGISRTFAADRVASINIATPRGRDTIMITDSSWYGQQDITVPVNVNTGTGNDTFFGLNYVTTLRDPQLTGGKSMDAVTATLWQELGAASGTLGNPTSNERPAGDGAGKITHFQHGAIYWTAANGAVEISGSIYQKWQQMGGMNSVLGAPVSNVQTTADGLGHIAYFKNGVIVVTAGQGTFAIHGAIYAAWQSAGGEFGALGEPVRVVHTGSGTTVVYFQYGHITQSPGKGVHVTYKYTGSFGGDYGGGGGSLGCGSGSSTTGSTDSGDNSGDTSTVSTDSGGDTSTVSNDCGGDTSTVSTDCGGDTSTVSTDCGGDSSTVSTDSGGSDSSGSDSSAGDTSSGDGSGGGD
jgi:uncharacterized protein with LGFP repeats